MEYGQVPGLDKPVARVVQGTVMLSAADMARSLQLLDEVYAQGGTAFDTAHQYGGGDAERVLGRWVRERGLQDKVVVITKGAHHNQDRKRVTPFDITADLHDSLARLRLEPIDLYLLHRDDPSVPVGPIIETLNEHQRAGKLRAFGASNWSVARIQAANAYAAAHGLQGFAASSPNFSLAVQIREPWPDCVSISGRQGERDRVWYTETGLPVFAWSSLAGGFFSGRFRRDNLDNFETPLDRLCAETYGSEENFRRLERAARLAADKDATLAQVALAYALRQPLNLFALVGCQTGAEFAENARALDVPLSQEEITWLEWG